MESEVDVYTSNDVAVKQIHVKQKGVKVFQHVHDYDHLSMLAVGSIEVWIDGVLARTAHAPEGINIKAHTPHEFVCLSDETIIYCVHNMTTGTGHTLNPNMEKS